MQLRDHIFNLSALSVGARVIWESGISSRCGRDSIYFSHLELHWDHVVYAQDSNDGIRATRSNTLSFLLKECINNDAHGRHMMNT